MRGLGGSLLRGDKLNDFAEAKERLERTAAGAQHASSLGVFAVACDAGGTCEGPSCVLKHVIMDLGMNPFV